MNALADLRARFDVDLAELEFALEAASRTCAAWRRRDLARGDERPGARADFPAWVEWEQRKHERLLAPTRPDDTHQKRGPMATTQRYDVKDLALAPEGVRRIAWADRQMPVLAAIRERFEREQPLAGHRISACLHVTTETANLARTLAAGGADVVLCASNPLSTQDDVAAALVEEFDVERLRDQGRGQRHLLPAHRGRGRPPAAPDDGRRRRRHRRAPLGRREQLGDVIAGTEETTTGVIRLKALERDGKLGFPVIAVNEARTKHLFDNRYGTGQSTIDGIIRATNVLLAGKRFVVAGYGWTGRGVAHAGTRHGRPRHRHRGRPAARARGGDGRLRGAPDGRAAAARRHLLHRHRRQERDHQGAHGAMKDGTILANTGHFNVEIEIGALRDLAVETREARAFVDEFTMADGRALYLIGEGRLVNLAAAEGHPALVMDMSFANQALSAEWVIQNAATLERKVYDVPKDIDDEIARLKLETMGIAIDTLTEEQAHYLASWDEGT